MRFKYLSLLSILLITACSSTGEGDTTNYQEHSYEEVSQYMIACDQVFSISDDEHYVYYFQETCRSCDRIKNDVIDFALNYTPHIYFIPADENTPTHYTYEEINETLGSNKIEDVFVRVTPQLALIKDGKIEKNIIKTIYIEEELLNQRRK
ncbi:MAG: hypothetical protein J5880_01620 [Bacilli bacterium]|nr:hypothetical protein [Bacilli bacterium]MBO4682372.1 hypothetical protein [Bacilli bacterium]